MRSVMAAAIVAALAGPAYGQGLPPIGIPMGEPAKEKPVDPIKENEYRSAIGGLPSQKSNDPWGNMRQNPPAQQPAAKKPPAKKDAASAKKNP